MNQTTAEANHLEGSQEVSLMTSTWRKDKPHFDLLRASIEASCLKNLRHYVVVQTEDINFFKEYSGNSNVTLLTTESLLPKPIERMRKRALRYQKLLGRHLTRLMGSLCQRTTYPRWPAYTGWHIQQISKLAIALQSETETVVVIDKDVIFTPFAKIDDFVRKKGIPCFEEWKPVSCLSNKVGNWHRQAYQLLKLKYPYPDQADIYCDTPFVFSRSAVLLLTQWLENNYEMRWWEALLQQPARKWSEFCTYKLFAREIMDEPLLVHDSLTSSRYIFEAGRPEELEKTLREYFESPEAHYVTIHSQNSGRQLWDIRSSAPRIKKLLDTYNAS